MAGNSFGSIFGGTPGPQGGAAQSDPSNPWAQGQTFFPTTPFQAPHVQQVQAPKQQQGGGSSSSSSSGGGSGLEQIGKTVGSMASMLGGGKGKAPAQQGSTMGMGSAPVAPAAPVQRPDGYVNPVLGAGPSAPAAPAAPAVQGSTQGIGMASSPIGPMAGTTAPVFGDMGGFGGMGGFFGGW